MDLAKKLFGNPKLNGIPNDFFELSNALSGHECVVQDRKGISVIWNSEDERARRFNEALAGRSLTWLANEVEIAVSTVSAYARGKAPNGITAVRIARTLGIDVEWYLVGDRIRARSEVVRVRRLSGHGVELEPVAFDTSAISRFASSGADLFVLVVDGEAMAPTIRSGAEALVVREARCGDGEVHVLRVGELLVTRRMRALLNGRFIALCDNPTFADERMEEIDGGLVQGRVVAVSHTL